MKLSLEQIRSVTRGAVNVTCEDGMYRFYRMAEGEYDESDKGIGHSTAGVVLEFMTDATGLSLKVKAEIGMEIRSFFSFDIFADDKLIGHIKNYEDGQCVGNYSSNKFEIGDFDGDFSLGDGEKKVKIVMPYSLIGVIRELELESASYITPVKKDKILIAYGDSITQGYDAQHPSKTYIMQLAEHLDVELFNKAIGGAIFEPWAVGATRHEKADYVTIAYGTNDWTVSDADKLRKDASDFFKTVEDKYPDAVKIVITPIWRASADDIKVTGPFSVVEEIITEEAMKYNDINVISGFDLVPHKTEMFGDLGLHPNDDGFDHYAENLIAAVDKLNLNR